MKLIDAHVHLWNPDAAPIDWIRDTSLPPAVDPDAFDAASRGIDVEAFVFIEAAVRQGDHRHEAAWVQGLAEHEPRLQAIIAHAPLERGAAVKDDLDALERLPLLRGVRRLLQQESDPAFCLRPAFVEGVRLLARYDLHFEICIYHQQLEHAVELVRSCPDVRFVLDHIAKPGIKDGITEPWRTQMRSMAAMPNVVCKLSGVATEADHAAWTEAELCPYIDHALDVFGPSRTMFGSDWPVSTVAIGYQRWIEIVEGALERFDPPDQQAVWRETARRVYRLGNTGGTADA